MDYLTTSFCILENPQNSLKYPYLLFLCHLEFIILLSISGTSFSV